MKIQEIIQEMQTLCCFAHNKNSVKVHYHRHYHHYYVGPRERHQMLSKHIGGVSNPAPWERNPLCSGTCPAGPPSKEAMATLDDCA